MRCIASSAPGMEVREAPRGVSQEASRMGDRRSEAGFSLTRRPWFGKAGTGAWDSSYQKRTNQTGQRVKVACQLIPLLKSVGRRKKL